MRDRLVLAYLVEHGASKAAAMSSDLGIPERTLRSDLARLREGGAVASERLTRGRLYRLADGSEG